MLETIVHSNLIWVLLISFLATLVRSTLGFGESLVAVPLLLLFLPADVAVPLSVMLSVVVAALILLQDHNKVYFQSAKWLLLYAALGIPFGILLLLYTDDTLIKIILGALIVFYSLYSLFNKKNKVLDKDSKTWLQICGFLSGVLGGAYGLNGPPLVIYGNLRQWSATHFRATLQAYFLPASLLGLIGYYVKGLVTSEVHHYFLWALLTAIPATYLGRYLNKRMNNTRFFRYVYWGLVGVGILLVGTVLLE